MTEVDLSALAHECRRMRMKATNDAERELWRQRESKA